MPLFLLEVIVKVTHRLTRIRICSQRTIFMLLEVSMKVTNILVCNQRMQLILLEISVTMMAS